MSLPGQIAEPGARPQSGLMSTLTPSRAPSGRAQKAFGQDYQFAETWDNPPPEFVVSTGQPGVGEGLSQGDGIHEDTRNNGSSGSFPKEAVWVPPEEEPWFKRIRPIWWVSLGIVIVGITAVTLAILAAMNLLGPHGSVPPSETSSSTLTQTRTSDHSSTSLSSLTSASPTLSMTTTSSTSSTATPTAVVKDCFDAGSFVNNVEWVGADKGYKAVFDGASSAGDCCNLCFGDTVCAGWIYNSTSKYTPCTKITLDADHPNPDSKCPKGYSSVTSVSKGGVGVAGIGPCSDKLSVN